MSCYQLVSQSILGALYAITRRNVLDCTNDVTGVASNASHLSNQPKQIVRKPHPPPFNSPATPLIYSALTTSTPMCMLNWQIRTSSSSSSANTHILYISHTSWRTQQNGPEWQVYWNTCLACCFHVNTGSTGGILVVCVT